MKPFQKHSERASVLVEFVACMMPLSILLWSFHALNEGLLQENHRHEAARLEVMAEGRSDFKSIEKDRVKGADKPALREANEIPSSYWNDSLGQGRKLLFWNETKVQLIANFMDTTGFDLKNQQIGSSHRLTRLYGRNAFHGLAFDSGVFLAVPLGLTHLKTFQSTRSYQSSGVSFLDQCHARFSGEPSCETQTFFRRRAYAEQVSALAKAAIAFDALSVVTGVGKIAKEALAKVINEVSKEALSRLLDGLTDAAINALREKAKSSIPSLESELPGEEVLP